MRLKSLLFLATGLPLALAAAGSPGADHTATLTVRAGERAAHRIPRFLTGKFCEHLGANIYNGMDAQVLRNPTLADFPLSTGQMTPDGLVTFHFEREKIDSELRRQAARSGWPDSHIPEMLNARAAGLAAFWGRVGTATEVDPSPDTGPHGGRAQRLQLKPGAGIKQWTWLPLHRVRTYEIEALARSPEIATLKVSLFAQDADEPCATATLEGVSGDWKKLKGSLAVPETCPASHPYRLEVTASTAGRLVLGHLFLWPSDHIGGADPDVIRLLRESRLPLLRWPGGNFVSAYHWEDGVGPVEQRPTRPNYAWGGVEPNSFGTAEFVTFCRAVGCEPMICVNAGTGTPAEAARWVEYCNGPVSSPGGARRAAHGYPEPFRIRHWEVGNELWGKWQARWTTAEGYVDRYLQFARAMVAADPAIRLYACGAPVLWGKAWNDTLIRGGAGQFQSITDHPLIGGNVNRGADPLDVFRDFMVVPAILERKWSELRADMDRGGIRDPRLAVTELQMFAHLGSAPPDGAPEKLNRQNLVNPSTLTEALYDTLVFHSAVRLQPFVEMITHSATVNHGGGLRKERERVYANPCHYANLLFANFAESSPVTTHLRCPSETAPLVLPEIQNAGGSAAFPVLDTLAAVTPNGGLLLSLVHRGASGPLRLTVKVDDFPASTARFRTLTGPVPWAVNSLDSPEAIRLVPGQTPVRDQEFVLELPACAVVQVALDRS